MQRHAGTAAGDGIRIAEEVGAALTRLDRFYGHLMSRDAMHERRAVALSADRRGGGRRHRRRPGGKRLLDEGLGGISITNDLARLDDPLCATVICDAPIWDTAGRAAQIPPNPQLDMAAARCTAPIRSTASRRPAGLDAGRLARPRWRPTTRRCARAARGDIAAALDQERRAAADRDGALLSRSRSAPASPTRWAASRSTGMAGCAVPTARRSTGLYAAGGCTGGLEGGGALGYVGGLIKADFDRVHA